MLNRTYRAVKAGLAAVAVAAATLVSGPASAGDLDLSINDDAARLNYAWTTADAILTPTLKVRRDAVKRRYAHEIEALYRPKSLSPSSDRA